MPLFDVIQIQFDKKIFEIAQYFRYRTAEEKEQIIVEGEIPDCFFILVSGRVEVTINGHHVRYLVAGDYFGEMALLEKDGQRTCTIKTVTACTLLQLEKEDWSVVLQIVPEFVGHFKQVKEEYEEGDKNRKNKCH
jgi:CRP-like cAMP-binding protein